MKFDQIVRLLRSRDLVVRAPEVSLDISALAIDSREVKPGALFIAERGSVVDGHAFIAQAISAGASALIAEKHFDTSLPLVIVRDGRDAVRCLAEAWYDYPARDLQLVGITGTNGKTTTTAITKHLLNAEHDAGSLGTLGAFDGHDQPVPSTAGTLTTPGALDLQATFRAMCNAGVHRVAMECSSHALDQGRLDGLSYDAAIFTNVTREHLDYHLTMEAYLQAKLRLADLVHSDGALAINADDPAWEPLRHDSRCIRWGVAPDADVRADGVAFSVQGARFQLMGRYGSREVAIPYLGEFNVSNALAAATVALALGIALDDVVARLANAPQVPGRLDRIIAEPFVVLRDYAHTPDAFERVLATLRPLTKGRLTLIFGCGGDRDRGKRPIMGRIAATLADQVVLTEDNPRTEDPERIIDDIVADMPAGSYERCTDREVAIKRVIARAEPGDVILLAGKGHETYQIIGKKYLPFDERQIVRRAMG